MQDEPIRILEKVSRPVAPVTESDPDEAAGGQPSKTKAKGRRKRQDGSRESAAVPENPTVPPPGKTQPPPPRKGEPVGQ